MREVVTQWLRSEPNRVGDQVTKLENGRLRDLCLEQIVGFAISQNEHELAEAWTDEVTDAELRSRLAGSLEARSGER